MLHDRIIFLVIVIIVLVVLNNAMDNVKGLANCANRIRGSFLSRFKYGTAECGRSDEKRFNIFRLTSIFNLLGITRNITPNVQI